MRLYLLGATVTSWCLPNGSDVLYIREDADFDGATPIKCAPALPPPSLSARRSSAPSATGRLATALLRRARVRGEAHVAIDPEPSRPTRRFALPCGWVAKRTLT